MNLLCTREGVDVCPLPMVYLIAFSSDGLSRFQIVPVLTTSTYLPRVPTPLGVQYSHKQGSLATPASTVSAAPIAPLSR